MPVVGDLFEHVEYVPTQIVTEFFRHAFREHDGSAIDGIRYPSSKNRGGANVVLFTSSSGCVDATDGWRERRSALLGLVASTVETLDPRNANNR
jgi:hypothetical protein